MMECEKLVQEVEKGRKNDPFWTIAVFLYRAQVRVWLGKYERGELLCGTCLMKREGYIDEEVKDDKDIFGSMPASFCS